MSPESRRNSKTPLHSGPKDKDLCGLVWTASLSTLADLHFCFLLNMDRISVGLISILPVRGPPPLLFWSRSKAGILVDERGMYASAGWILSSSHCPSFNIKGDQLPPEARRMEFTFPRGDRVWAHSVTPDPRPRKRASYDSHRTGRREGSLGRQEEGIPGRGSSVWKGMRQLACVWNWETRGVNLGEMRGGERSDHTGSWKLGRNF